MKIRIIKARHDKLWYSGKIGSEWEVKHTKHVILRKQDSYYSVEDNLGMTHGIYIEDCVEVVPEHIPEELFEL